MGGVDLYAVETGSPRSFRRIGKVGNYFFGVEVVSQRLLVTIETESTAMGNLQNCRCFMIMKKRRDPGQTINTIIRINTKLTGTRFPLRVRRMRGRI